MIRTLEVLLANQTFEPLFLCHTHTLVLLCPTMNPATMEQQVPLGNKSYMANVALEVSPFFVDGDFVPPDRG